MHAASAMAGATYLGESSLILRPSLLLIMGLILAWRTIGGHLGQLASDVLEMANSLNSTGNIAATVPAVH